MEYPQNACISQEAQQYAQVGSANNFCGQIGERALKGIVKDHAQPTQ